jgi:hypothetical protein
MSYRLATVFASLRPELLAPSGVKRVDIAVLTEHTAHEELGGVDRVQNSGPEDFIAQLTEVLNSDLLLDFSFDCSANETYPSARMHEDNTCWPRRDGVYGSRRLSKLAQVCANPEFEEAEEQVAGRLLALFSALSRRLYFDAGGIKSFLSERGNTTVSQLWKECRGTDTELFVGDRSSIFNHWSVEYLRPLLAIVRDTLVRQSLGLDIQSHLTNGGQALHAELQACCDRFPLHCQSVELQVLTEFCDLLQSPDLRGDTQRSLCDTLLILPGARSIYLRTFLQALERLSVSEMLKSCWSA